MDIRVKCPSLLLDFYSNLNFLDIFSKNIQIQNFVKIRPVEAEFHADGRTRGRTDMTKTTVAFSNFANAPYRNGNKKTFKETD
jgi:hypothetical protein